MADHVRTQIRQALKTRLTGLATTGAHVFTAQVYPLDDSDLPGILIKNGNEQSQIVTMPELQRQGEFLVMALAKANNALDDTLDTICKEVEAAVATDDTLSGLCSGGLVLASTGFEMSGDAEHPVGMATMTWTGTYYNFKATPDVAR